MAYPIANKLKTRLDNWEELGTKWLRVPKIKGYPNVRLPWRRNLEKHI